MAGLNQLLGHQPLYMLLKTKVLFPHAYVTLAENLAILFVPFSFLVKFFKILSLSHLLIFIIPDEGLYS